MLLEFLVERTAWDAEPFSRCFNMATLFLKYTFNVLFFQFDEGQTRGPGRRTYRGMALEIQIP
jgi:hypothetical protein